MSPTATTPTRIAPATKGHDVSIARLYVLRATYLLIVVGLALVEIPILFDHAPSDRGVITSLLSGIWLLALLGLRYPLQNGPAPPL